MNKVAMVEILNFVGYHKDIEDPVNSGETSEVWSSAGGIYKQTDTAASGNFYSVFPYGSDIYTISANIDESGSITYEICLNGSEIIYTLSEGTIECADASDEGI